MPDLRVHPARIPDDLPIVRELFLEHSVAIADVAACSLQFQGFERELSSLPVPYEPPMGRIYLATAGGTPVGCVAIKPLKHLGDGTGEVKRMYVRPSHRGLGLGHMLIETLVADARTLGYNLLKLDTSTSMHAAIAAYRHAGFAPCARYNDDPMEDTLWFEKHL